MKNLKKWLAALLSVILVMGMLVGCSKENTGTPVVPTTAQGGNSATTTVATTVKPTETTVLPTEPAPVPPTEPAPVPPTEPTPDPNPNPNPGPDDIFNVVATEETLDLYTELAFEVDTSDGGYTIGIKEISEDLLVMYMVYEDICFVVEMNQDGTVTGYCQTEKGGAFELTDETKAQEGAQAIMGVLMILVKEGSDLGAYGETYERQPDATMKTGAAYVYKQIYNNEHTGNFWVDQATGFIVKAASVENGQSQLVFEVTELTTSNITLPQYK